MLRRITNNLRKQDWSQALFELIIVAVGILMAFQVDRWRDVQNDRNSEQAYLSRLSEDIDDDIVTLTYAIEIAELRLEFVKLLIDVAEDPALALRSPVEFIIAVSQAAYTYTPPLSSNTFDELRSTGNIGLLQATELKDALFTYYGYDESQRQFINLQQEQEMRHFDFGMGILTNRQAIRADEDWGIANRERLITFTNDEVDLDGVIAAATRLQHSTNFVAWLPKIHWLQIDLAYVNSERRRLATELQEILRKIRR